jgi:hypothetical protein
MIDHTPTKKRSLGKLRIAHKTKERSPNMTGTFCLQRHDLLQDFRTAD